MADPRLGNLDGYGNKYAVSEWDKPAPTVIGNRVGGGGLIIEDPRTEHYNNILKVCDWNEPGASVTGGSGVMSGGLSVADPRLHHPTWNRTSIGKLSAWDEPCGAIIANPDIFGAGTASVQDPRISEKWSGAGNFKVMPWNEPANAMTAHTDIHAAAGAVADPRVNPTTASGPPPFDKGGIPGADERGVWIIVSLDGTWHRPITTYEMAMLQGMPTHINGMPFELPGNSDAKWREWIGNMVPVQAGTAIGNALLRTMMPNYAGEWHWDVDGNDLWVREEEIIREWKNERGRGYYQAPL